MDRERLIALHPVLYHMADARNWESIRRLGLLGTSALLDAFSIAGDERSAIESTHRPDSVAIPAAGPHPTLGVAFVRDQRPLQMAALAACLDELTPDEWLRRLNARVFFWPDRDRLARMLKAYAADEQALIEVDTRRLVDRHGDRIELSHINSGYANLAYRSARRGPQTFVPLDAYAYSSKNAIAEVTVLGSVPDLFDLTVRVIGHRRGRADRILWEC